MFLLHFIILRLFVEGRDFLCSCSTFFSSSVFAILACKSSSKYVLYSESISLGQFIIFPFASLPVMIIEVCSRVWSFFLTTQILGPLWQFFFQSSPTILFLMIFIFYFLFMCSLIIIILLFRTSLALSLSCVCFAKLFDDFSSVSVFLSFFLSQFVYLVFFYFISPFVVFIL